jgi:hypothetical protein
VALGEFTIYSIEPALEICPQAMAFQVVAHHFGGIQTGPQRQENIAPRHTSAKYLETHGAHRNMIVKSQQLRWLQPPLTVRREPFC